MDLQVVHLQVEAVAEAIETQSRVEMLVQVAGLLVQLAPRLQILGLQIVVEVVVDPVSVA
jgi:hypothetical protein